MIKTHTSPVILRLRLCLLLSCVMLVASCAQPPPPQALVRLRSPAPGVLRKEGEMVQDALYDVGLYRHRLQQEVVKKWARDLQPHFSQMTSGTTVQVEFHVNAESQVEDVKVIQAGSPANKVFAAAMQRAIRAASLPPLPDAVVRGLRKHHARQPMLLEVERPVQPE